jgi:hypothetical protein
MIDVLPASLLLLGVSSLLLLGASLELLGVALLLLGATLELLGLLLELGVTLLLLGAADTAMLPHCAVIPGQVAAVAALVTLTAMLPALVGMRFVGVHVRLPVTSVPLQRTVGAANATPTVPVATKPVQVKLFELLELGATELLLGGLLLELGASELLLGRLLELGASELLLGRLLELRASELLLGRLLELGASELLLGRLLELWAVRP